MSPFGNMQVAPEAQQPKETSKARKAGPSRTSKRKATKKASAAVSESEDDKMRIEEGHAEEIREQEEQMPEAVTPDRSEDDETEDEDGVAGPPASQPSQSTTVGVGSKGKAPELVKAMEKEHETPKELPPRRALPFASKKPQNQPAKAAEPAPRAAIADDDETDDEL